MSKPFLLVANWKMNLRASESLELAQQILSKRNSFPSNYQIWLAPSFIALPALAPMLRDTFITLGAQNAHWSDKGAFTGEISIPMLMEHDVRFVIVGHSERRHIFSETDAMVVERAQAVLAHGLTVIFCLGERLDERERGQTLNVLERQLTALLDEILLEGIDPSCAERIIIAYEPVWAIGTGRVAEVADIKSAHSRLAEIWQQRLGISRPRILYGGSVTPQNFPSIGVLDCVDGALVGGTSLEAETFAALASL